MAGQTIADLARLMDQINRSVQRLAGVGRGFAGEVRSLAVANQLRAGLGTATTSAATIRVLQNVLRQGMGGTATAEIRASILQYQQALTPVQQAMAAIRGQTAALGPGGIPRGGGMAALGRVAAGSGLGGMGTLVGSLFGQAGAGLGFAFDLALRGVTGAFKALETTVKNSRLIIDKLSVWSFGGMQAAITLTITEIQNQIKMSGELGNTMIKFANAQSRSMKAWLDFDIAVERLNLEFATAWENVKAFFGEKVGGPLGRAINKPEDYDPFGNWMIKNLPTAIGDLIKYLQGREDKDKVHEDLTDVFTPWEKQFQEMERMAKGIRQGGGVDVWGNALKNQLGMAPGGGPGQPGGLIPGGPGGFAGVPWQPPPPPVPQQPPPPPPAAQPKDPVEEKLDVIIQMFGRAINDWINQPPNFGFGGGP